MVGKFWRPKLPLNGHIWVYGRTDCMPKGSKVLMADGSWKNVDKIKVGDYVLSPQKDGTTTFEMVINTTDYFCNDVYDVIKKKDGSKLLTCSRNHKIPVYNSKAIRKQIDGYRKYINSKWRIKNYTIEQLSKMSSKKRNHNNFAFSTFPIKKYLGRKNLDIDPYSLGVFLGDGTFTKNKTLSISSWDNEIIDRIPYDIMSIGKDNHSFNFSSKDKFALMIKKLGLYGKKSKDKFIPGEALYSDINFRKRLLEGLIDTDGYMSNGCSYEFCLSSKKLIYGIRELIFSIGGKCGRVVKCKKEIKEINYKGEYYRMFFYLGNIKLKLLKRKMRKSKTHFMTPNRFSIDVVKAKPCQVYGFSITGKSKWFITNNFMVVHNSGKTWKMMAVVQFYHANGYKLWDLWGGKRKEGGFWCFASDERKLWFEYQKEVGEMSSPGGKEYKVKLAYPFFEEELPKKLPEKKPRIIASVFTIYFKDVEIEEISTITGSLAKKAQNAWKDLKKELPDNANGEDILNWFEKTSNKELKRTIFYTSFIKPFCENKVLAGKDCQYNLDIEEESKEKDQVFVLMNEYTPKEYTMFFILFILRTIYDKGERDIIHRQHLAIFRELNYFMKVQDESSQDADQKQIMRNHFSDIARYGRSVVVMAGDTQSPSEVKGLVEGQDDILLINELPSQKDRETACDRLVSDGRMSPNQRDYLGSVEMTQEKMVVVERGDYARLIRRVQPPRTKCFKRDEGSFERVWKAKNDGHWNKEIPEIKKYVSNQYFLRKMLIKEMMEKAAAEKELKQQQDKEKGKVVVKSPQVETIEKDNNEEVKKEEQAKNAEDKERYKQIMIEKLREEVTKPIAV